MNDIVRWKVQTKADDEHEIAELFQSKYVEWTNYIQRRDEL
jgi:hypothetical protein